MGANPPISEIIAMESSFAVVNSRNAVSFDAYTGTKASSTSSLYISAHRRYAMAKFICCPGHTGLSSSHFCVCKDQDVKKLNRKVALIVSPSPLSCQSSMPLAAPSSAEHPRAVKFGHLMSKEHGLDCLEHQVDSNPSSMMVEKLVVMKLMLQDNWLRSFKQLKSQSLQRLAGGRKGLISLIAALICLTCPNIVSTNVSIGFSDNVALAQPLGQIRQAALFLERFAENSASTKVLDKVMTVITGQTVVTPETIEQLKSVIDGERSHNDWQTDLANNAESFGSTIFDAVTNFNPLSLMEATGNGIQGLVEAAADRFAAFELSSLVALGERWILWTPFVVIPMYWQMTRHKRSNDGGAGRGKSQPATLELSEEAVAKAAKVRDELERIELKAYLLDLVYSLGKLAWQSNRSDQNTTRKQIDEILASLQELNPTSSTDVGSALLKVTQVESAIAKPAVDVDGEWNLIYVSQAPNGSLQTQLPQFPNLDVPGIEFSNMQQKLWWKRSRSSSLPINENEAEHMLARNTAQIRLGPLGVVEMSVQGSWENRRDGKSALVSFDTFSAKPIEVLGSLVREDFPPLDLSIPRALQTSGEWETVYLDNSLRIDRGTTGQFYLFRKSE